MKRKRAKKKSKFLRSLLSQSGALRLASPLKFKRPQIILAVVAVVIVGVAVLAFTHASANTASVEAEDGTLAGNASIAANSNASGGKLVQLGPVGASGSPSPTPSPTPATGATPLGVSGNWTPTFDDEFNSTAVDTSKWTVEGPTGPNNDQEYACYSPSAVSEAGGSLNLAILNTKCSAGGTTYQYTGSQMDTSAHFTQTYGYYEARIWSAGSNGTVANWGGWWLVGNTWPQGGEVDIFEGFHGTAGYHFEYAPSGTAIWQGSQASGDYTGWHTYGVNWQPNSLTFYYDGQKMASYTTGVPTVAKHLMLTYSNGPLNNVGGPVLVPATQKIDYVRVWK